MTNLKPCFSSVKDNWCTPQVVVNAVIEFANKIGEYSISLDPCSNSNSIVPATTKYTIESNGLIQPWGGGVIYVNPPYGRSIGKWIEKCNQEATSEHKPDILALLPSRTDTKWYHAAEFNAKCEWKGRLRFNGAESSAPFPSVILHWGPHAVEFWQMFKKFGKTWLIIRERTLED